MTSHAPKDLYQAYFNALHQIKEFKNTFSNRLQASHSNIICTSNPQHHLSEAHPKMPHSKTPGQSNAAAPSFLKKDAEGTLSMSPLWPSSPPLWINTDC